MKKILLTFGACLMSFLLGGLAAPSETAPDPMEQERAYVRLYDAAMTIVYSAKEYYDECSIEEREFTDYAQISGANRQIIDYHRAPNLHVLLDAIEEMDEGGCLADSFDEPLIEFDAALEEYNRIVKI